MAMVEPRITNTERFETTQPYSLLNRKERSRELAQKRRTTYKMLMKDLAEELPFSKDVVSQIDYNSRLRLALCFFQMKTLLNKKDGNQALDDSSSSTNCCKGVSVLVGNVVCVKNQTGLYLTIIFKKLAFWS